MTTFILQLKECCPRLSEVTSVIVEVISEENIYLSHHHGSCSVRLLLEGLFAHFFSPDRPGYHTEDVQWFLELANKQEQWKANLLGDANYQKHHQLVTRTEVGHLSVVHRHLRVNSANIPLHPLS